MKAEINENKKGFEPIEVKITIESMDELLALITRLDAPDKETYKWLSISNTIDEKLFSLASNKLWKSMGEPLLEIAKQRNK